MQTPASATLPYTFDEALHDILADGARTAASLGFGYRRLWATLVDATGGKRFRPALFTTTYRAWGGTDDRAAATVAAAIELLHTAFVVHDDVIDGEDTRRGRPNVSGSHVDQARGIGVDELRATGYGAAAGILAGDLALAAALRAVATCPAPRATVLHLLDLFDAALHTSAAGELADVRLSLGVDSAALSETLTVEERKTGVYSFSLPLQAGAVLAGASADAVESAGQVGRCLGIAYQLVDDVDGVFGDPAITGKSTLSDLRSGKQTPLIAHARTTSSWPVIAPYVGRADLTDTEASRVRDLLTGCGSRRFVEDLVDEYLGAAEALCEESGMPPALASWIHSMAADLFRRVA
ncbi:MAG: geranylgeranyl diphosphate synthase, type [Nocardioidaceae bacterium]|nr:geranylgeranyl diphosphate synthase, type [Nocardioidaceae bacterium]